MNVVNHNVINLRVVNWDGDQY